MTAGLFNATLSEEFLNQVSEGVAVVSLFDIIFSLLLLALMVGSTDLSGNFEDLFIHGIRRA